MKKINILKIAVVIVPLIIATIATVHEYSKDVPAKSDVQHHELAMND
ncbi:MAG: hypothetical protein MI922_12165 [Bacteroidales bacterium]|nr:hypothetical protein [Bacteroidales bacterium]